jgi:hypothetical protein
LFPNRPNAYESTKQRRDFTAQEWQFFETFFVRNDFAGFLLYVDLLPAETLAGFHTRFGEPSATAYAYAPLGRIEFIPKRPEWRGLLDRHAGARVRFQKPAQTLERGKRLDLGTSESDDFLMGGWSYPAASPRWTTEREAVVGFVTRRDEDVLFRARVGAWGPQHVTVRWNGTIVSTFDPPMDDWQVIEIAIPATILGADNRVTFVLSDPLPVRAEDGVKHIGMRVDWIELD